MMATIVYLLCVVTSALCAALLFREYPEGRLAAAPVELAVVSGVGAHQRAGVC